MILVIKVVYYSIIAIGSKSKDLFYKVFCGVETGDWGSPNIDKSDHPSDRSTSGRADRDEHITVLMRLHLYSQYYFYKRDLLTAKKIKKYVLIRQKKKKL